jgi:hypothetical protein
MRNIYNVLKGRFLDPSMREVTGTIGLTGNSVSFSRKKM